MKIRCCSDHITEAASNEHCCRKKHDFDDVWRTFVLAIISVHFVVRRTWQAHVLAVCYRRVTKVEMMPLDRGLHPLPTFHVLFLTVTRSSIHVSIMLWLAWFWYWNDVMLTDVPRDRYGPWVPALLHAIMAVLRKPSAPASVGGASGEVGGVCELPSTCTKWNVTSYSIQFHCAGVDVDIFLTSDWSTKDADSAYPRYDALYDVTCQQTNHADRYW